MNNRPLQMLMLSLCVMMLILSACGQAPGEEPEKREPNMSHHSREPVNPPQPASEYWNVDPQEEQALAEEAKASTEGMEQVTNAHAVSLDNHVYVTPEVKHLTRWHLEAFREEGREQLKETLPPDTIIHLSTDYKANMELKRLTEDIQSGTVSGEELDRRLDSITEFMKTDV